ncbi:MAG: hypothetical protein ACKVIY_02860 [Acidimicrobiales bacterium]|jgi:hypothetical protein
MSEIVGAHLVGSAPVETPEEMFRLATASLGSRLGRVGDGEIGERDTWIGWQYPRLAQSAQLEPALPDEVYRQLKQFEVVPDPGPIELVDLGYAEAAIESYEVFARMKRKGEIPNDVRFMVGLPSPLSVVTMYVAPGSRGAVLERYSEAMSSQLDRILAAVPAEELAIQWEVCIEFGILEELWTLLDTDHRGVAARSKIAEQIVALGNLVPEPAELGYHLCYGDSGHSHFTQPTDAGHLAWAARAILDGVRRTVQWIHMPVPKERDDVAYFEPLSTLNLPATTELFLGLVHETGGIEGTRRRIAAAEQVVPRFGVATECGLGRRPRDTIAGLLDQHAAVTGER